ncbi:MAG: trypsin-like peptidase domain-containing protein, partial [Wenzhouxiangella sp.]|nr:trypsin-like peptidase domain-containing protein [Wenzhouxiangella sp.]
MLKFLQFLASSIVVGLAIAFVVVFLRPDLLPALQTTPEPIQSGYAEAVNQAAPSVVSIYTRTLVRQPLAGTGLDPLFQRLYQDRVITRPRRGLGSGVIVSEDGLILTTLHVISGVDNIVVALWDGRIAEARVVGSDPGTDLAVLKIDLEGLPAARLSDSGQMRT